MALYRITASFILELTYCVIDVNRRKPTDTDQNRADLFPFHILVEVKTVMVIAPLLEDFEAPTAYFELSFHVVSVIVYGKENT